MKELMPSNWKLGKLSDYFDITSSKRVFQSQWKKQGVPFYRAREIVSLAKNGFVNNELYITNEMYEEYERKYGIPKESDLMITGVGTLGICYVVKKNDKFYFKDGNIIWLKKKAEIDSKYVEYAFKTIGVLEQVHKGSGATVGTYTIIKAKNTVIPVPPIEEQKRIVSILDYVFMDAKRAEEIAERNRQNAVDLFEDYLEGSLRLLAGKSELITLNQVCSFENGDRGSNYPSKKYRTASGIPFINAGHFNNGIIDYSTMDYIPDDRYELLGGGKVKKGDVLFCLRGSLGKFADVENLEKGAIASSLVIVRPKEQLLKEFLLFYFRSKTCQKMIAKYAGGTAQPNLGASDLKKFQLLLPDLDAQKTIINKLQYLDMEIKKLGQIYVQKESNLVNLRKSVLNKAFRGEL